MYTLYTSHFNTTLNILGPILPVALYGLRAPQLADHTDKHCNDALEASYTHVRQAMLIVRCTSFRCCRSLLQLSAASASVALAAAPRTTAAAIEVATAAAPCPPAVLCTSS